MKTFTNLAHRAFKKCASLGTINKKRYYLFVITMLLTLGVGNAWGAEETVVYTETFEDSAYQTSTTYNNSTEKKHGPTNTQWGVLCGTPNTGAHNGSKAFAMRYYKSVSKTPTLTQYFDINNVDAISFWSKTESTNNKLNVEYSTDGGSSWSSLASNISITTAYKEYSYNFSTQQAKVRLRFTMGTTTEKKSMFIDDIEFISTSSTGSGTEEPVLSATPTEIDFGTVYQGTIVEDKTVAVNFENLTGAVTYSGLSTPFTATGTISNDGDKITIAANTATIKEYSQTLTITSAADSKTAEVTVKMNVVEKPAPTGTFTLHTGALVEGDYVIVSTNSLKAEVNSDRLASLPVTISNDEIVDPDATTIWHIAKSGEYWTLYNANKAKYAASTGAKNKAALLGDATDDKALWSVTGTSTYEFVNKKNTANSVNANLRYNSGNAENSRWACYSTSTGGALSLYRKAGTKYNVTVSSTTNGSVTASPTSAEAGATIALTVTPDAGYVLDVLTVTYASSNTIEVADNKFTMPAADVTISATFKENEKPAATLTLSKNGVPETFPGSWKQDDVVTLPTNITNDCVKQFVGWSTEEIDKSSKKPTSNFYEPGADYTLAATSQTLYAVYATVQGGGEATSEDLFENNGTYNSTAGTITWELANVVSILQEKSNASSSVADYVTDPRWYKDHLITITPSANIKEIVVKAQSNDYATALASSTYTNATATANGDVVTITPTDGNEKITIKMGAQARLFTLTVTYAATAIYSDYSTACAAALANPTFSLAEGKYTETKSVEIEYTEGTVYYTMDGTEPTASSTQYTGAIALTDCGEYTFKAIAISSDSQSDVVSATYTIKLPLTNSEAAPYTEAEAIAVYDGGCYDNQDVYVKGTVKTATFNSTYGNYTITLTNGFQFYRFLQAAETKFTEDIIVPGDVLVACGKLSEYNTTYQLAEGCYLVERIPYEGEKTDISNTEATAYTVDQAFALIADVKSDLTKEVYVKGLVAVAPTSNPTADGQMTYKISDNGENTGNVLTVYLGLNLNGEKFTSKNDVQQGDYVVVKGKLLDYNSTYELNKGNQLVQHVKAATIKIADITMEVGETKTIAATITPAAAETAVVYTIKENTDNAISLSGNTITADAVGTATITATIATAAEYMGKTVEFKVTVNPVASISKVIILAQYGDEWYAMTNVCTDSKQMGALKVNFQNGVLYDVAESDKASITWELSVLENKATFKNSDKYLIGGTSTTLNYANSKFEWVVDGDKYLSDSKTRSFMYNKAGYFKNYAISNVGNSDYSGLPVVTAPVYVKSASALTGKFSTGKYEYAVFAPGNLQYNVGSSTWAFAENQYDYVGDDNINVGDPTFTGTIDMFGWSTNETNYGVDPRNLNELYDGEFVDWGNLFPVEDNWSTLSADQWKYLLNTRTNASSLKQIARVGSVVGIMLFPDVWNAPLTVTAQRDSYFEVDIHNYTLEQWAELEEAGALFLPAAGRRTGGYGNMINYDQQVETREDYLVNGGFYRWKDNTNIYCYYWTSTINEDKNVSYLHNIVDLGNDEYTIGTGAIWGEKGRYGQSVRLAKVTDITPETYTRTVTPGKFGTICLPFGGTVEGAELFECVGQETGKVYIASVTTLAAGVPYIFLATGTELAVYSDGTTAATPGKHNGLVGTFTDDTEVAVGNYILKDNALCPSDGTAKVNANRAYLVMGEVPADAPQQMPGRRYIGMSVQGENETTGFENITNGENTTIKLIENGQLIIIRGGEKFNAQGQKF